MTPKEKASELVEKFKRAAHGSDFHQAHESTVSFNDIKNVVLLCVDEIIDSHIWVNGEVSANENYYIEVKQEIEKL